MKVESKAFSKYFLQESRGTNELNREVKSVPEIVGIKADLTYRVKYSANNEYVFQNLYIDKNVNLEKVNINIDIVFGYLRNFSVESLRFYHKHNKNDVKDIESNYWIVKRYLDIYPLYKMTYDLDVIEYIGCVIFNFYKFRSMYQDVKSGLEELLSINEVEGDINFKMKNDPRIKLFVGFIRKTSFDGPSQLVNILNGNRAIIGPCFGLPREIEQYPSVALDRVMVSQRLYGEWQANGRSNTAFDGMIKMHLAYIQNNRNFWGDTGLIFKTVWGVIAGKGA